MYIFSRKVYDNKSFGDKAVWIYQANFYSTFIRPSYHQHVFIQPEPCLKWLIQFKNHLLSAERGYNFHFFTFSWHDKVLDLLSFKWLVLDIILSPLKLLILSVNSCPMEGTFSEPALSDFVELYIIMTPSGALALRTKKRFCWE